MPSTRKRKATSSRTKDKRQKTSPPVTRSRSRSASRGGTPSRPARRKSRGSARRRALEELEEESGLIEIPQEPPRRRRSTRRQSRSTPQQRRRKLEDELDADSAEEEADVDPGLLSDVKKTSKRSRSAKKKSTGTARSAAGKSQGAGSIFAPSQSDIQAPRMPWQQIFVLIALFNLSICGMQQYVGLTKAKVQQQVFFNENAFSLDDARWASVKDLRLDQEYPEDISNDAKAFCDMAKTLQSQAAAAFPACCMSNPVTWVYEQMMKPEASSNECLSVMQSIDDIDMTTFSLWAALLLLVLFMANGYGVMTVTTPGFEGLLFNISARIVVFSATALGLFYYKMDAILVAYAIARMVVPSLFVVWFMLQYELMQKRESFGESFSLLVKVAVVIAMTIFLTFKLSPNEQPLPRIDEVVFGAAAVQA